MRLDELERGLDALAESEPAVADPDVALKSVIRRHRRSQAIRVGGILAAVVVLVAAGGALALTSRHSGTTVVATRPNPTAVYHAPMSAPTSLAPRGPGPVACTAGDLSATTGSQGENTGREITVFVTNVSGARCWLTNSLTAELSLTGTDGTDILISLSTPPTGDSTTTPLAPGAKAQLGLWWGNWCAVAVRAVRVNVHLLDGGTVSADLRGPGPADGPGTPPLCLQPGDPSILHVSHGFIAA